MSIISEQAQAMQNEHDNFKRDVIAAANGLNYWGKKLDTVKAGVIHQLAEQFADGDDEGTIESTYKEIEKILLSETKPKAAKVARAAKEKPVDTRPISAGALSHVEDVRPTMHGKRFLVTSAQNNTEVHAAFFANLLVYAEHIGAIVLVFPFLYNKNGFQNGEGQENVWYADVVRPYMCNASHWLGEDKKVSAMAFNILPTVAYPLSGMRSAIGKAEAMIVPHATIAHECVPVLGAQYGKTVPQMYTTGTVTQRNYIQQAIGQKAENRHSFGALIVEFNDEGQFWIRQIETDESGEFQDLRSNVSGAIFDSDVSVLNYGDIHAEKLNLNVSDAQWTLRIPNIELSSMLDYLRPSYQMAHDLLDFQALNHHNRDNHFHMAENQVSGRTVADDMSDVSTVLSAMERDWCETVVVRSNHDDALDRWLADGKYEPRKDPANALLYYQLQVKAYTAIGSNDTVDMLPTALELAVGGKPTATFLRASESFIVNGVELGEHGHSGINGSRGSPKQFANAKMTTGHTHSSSIYGGCYTAGVSGKLAMGYNETGASSWVHSTVVQYHSGMRAILHLKDDGKGKLDYMAR